ncbi:MAG: aconitase X catalytic domain-containing protein [Candidatus Bathyarchaeia archaeon]
MKRLYLNREEERIYNGDFGWAYEISMKILVKLGDLYGAERLIPIESAHVSGVSYKTIGNAPIEFLEALVASNGRVKVDSTINPSSIDFEDPSFNLLPGELIEKQKRIIDLYSALGIEPTLTCTPYYIRQIRTGSHVSWAESSAVIYANSILGAWTNREGGPSALASALIGKTPDYGLHRPENRRASVLVKVEADILSESDYGSLGIYLGKVLGDSIPVIQGKIVREECFLKQMGAAMATSGMVSMFYLNGLDDVSQIEEKITVDNRDIRRSYEELSSAFEKPDLIFIGCPHCSLEEIKSISSLLYGRRIKEDIKLWVCTPRFIRSRAYDCVKVIEASGGRVISDTCAVVTWLRELGVETLVTNSAKTAYYAPLMSNVKAILLPLKKCIEVALREV